MHVECSALCLDVSWLYRCNIIPAYTELQSFCDTTKHRGFLTQRAVEGSEEECKPSLI
jgi:hypothetical protein